MPKYKDVAVAPMLRQLAEIEQEKRRVAAEIRKLKRTARARVATHREVTDAAAFLSQPTGEDLARQYLVNRGHRDDEVSAALERARSLDLRIDPIVEPNADVEADATVAAGSLRAQRWLEESRLHDFVEQQNLSKGLSPTGAAVWEHRKSLGHGRHFSPKSKTMSQWLRRWRRRWGIHLGQLAQRESISDSAAQYKVRGDLIGAN